MEAVERERAGSSHRVAGSRQGTRGRNGTPPNATVPISRAPTQATLSPLKERAGEARSPAGKGMNGTGRSKRSDRSGEGRGVEVEAGDLVHFLTDIRQLDDHEVLQLPLTRTSERAQRALRKAGADLRVDDDTSVNPSLDDYLGAVGRYFGKNPNYWESAGSDKVEVFEEPGKRTTKRTTTFWGWNLNLFWELPFYDIRLTSNEPIAARGNRSARPIVEEGGGEEGHHHSGEADAGRPVAMSKGYPKKREKITARYDIKYREIKTNEDWLQLIYDQPWSGQARLRKTAEFLQAKVEHDDVEVQLEGVHGMWELAVNPDNHNDIVRVRVLCLVDCLKSPDWRVVHTTASAIWALSTSSSHRRTFGDAGVVQQLLVILKETMKLEVVTENSAKDENKGDEEAATPKSSKSKSVEEKTRDDVQSVVIGTLAMLLVDRNCRAPLIQAEPNFKTLLTMCRSLEGYKDEVTAKRRVDCARILCSLIQRDGEVRHSLIKSGQLKTLLALMSEAGGPGFLQLCFCMAAALATLVLDEEVMTMVRQRGEAPIMFSACMQLLRQTLDVLDKDGTEDMNAGHAVKLAEAAGQAMWGSAYECVQPDGGGATVKQIDILASMAFQTIGLARYPVARVLHCVAATVATLGSNEEAAGVIMESHVDGSEDGPVNAMLQMIIIKEDQELRGNGHTRAAATTGLAFLAGHSFTAQGDECMFGPHRERLLASGAMDRLLEAALTKDADPELFKVIQHSAAVGVMYLSTMAGTVSAKALAMLAALMQNSANIEMIEYLMAAFWILLRNGGNRKLLSEAFDTNPMEDGEGGPAPAGAERQQSGSKLRKQLQDVSDTNEVSDSVQAAQNQLEQNFGSMHLDKEEKYKAEDSQKVGDDGLRTIDETGSTAAAESAREGGNTPTASGDDAAPTEADAGSGEDGDSPGLKKDWGLEILVSVGQTWIDALLNSDDMTEGDAPLLKLFEFLVASLCLFLIDEDSPVLPRRMDVFELGVPPGGRKRQTWWSVSVTPPGVEPREPRGVENALLILCKLLTLRMYIGWKVVQLSVSSLWNCTVRSASVEKLVVRAGAVELLINIASTEYWPATLREAAAGHLMHLAEEWANIEHVDGTRPLQAVMIKLLRTKHPLLEMRGARYLGRMTYYTPYLQPRPKAAMVATKANIAALDGITQLVKLLVRCQKRYAIRLESERDGDEVNFRPTVDAGEEEHPALYEKDCNGMVAVLENYYYTLCALLNLSTLNENQTIIARKGLRVLLGIISYFSRQSATISDPNGVETKLYMLASSIIQNLSLHPKNRTVFYKAELTGSAALERELEEGGEEVVVLPRMKLPVSRSLPTMEPSRLTDPRVHKSLLEPINTVRPKVAFPIISPGSSLMPSAGSVGAEGLGDRHDGSAAHHNLTGSLTRAGGHETGSIAEMDDGEEGVRLPPLSPPVKFDDFGAQMDEDGEGRERFLRWIESEEELSSYGKPMDVSLLPGFARPKDYTTGNRRRMFDEEGNWVTEAKDLKGLPQLLRRPMSHLWEETPDHNLRNGKQRWEPNISEFRQPKAPVMMGDVAGRLLTTQRPNNTADNLLRAAVDISQTGRVHLAQEALLTMDRPTTSMRNGGRMALTTLLPDEELLRSSWTKGKEDVRWEQSGAVSLNVVLAPSRDRTVISFQEKLVETKDPNKPRLSVFEAVDGSKVYQDLFPSYQLPNGKRAHFYFQGGSLVDEVEVLLPAPPARPSSIPSALQRQFPMTQVLNKISRPPGSAPPFIPYKPVPRLAPLPEKHTLRVKAPHVITTKSFGNLRSDNLQFIVKFNRITTTETETSAEDVYVPPPEEREPWELPKSIFKPRVKESDARDFWDNDTVVARMFERDWQRATSKEKFMGFLVRENKSNTSNDKPTDEESIKQVHDVLKKYYKFFYSCFMYFASIGSGSPFHIQLNSWTMFLDTATIPDVESQYIKRSDCDTLFIVSNYQADKKAPENKVNDEHALMRFEFLEAIIRCSAAKYGKGIATMDLAEAVEMLFMKNVLPSLTPYSSIWPNDFRETRLYTEECDDLFKKHSVLLKAIYSRYRLRPSGGGLRPKVLKLDGWQKLMDDACMCDSQFTLQDATQCFMWSRMAVIDELKDFARYECLTFIDFLEALGRVAELKFIPAASDLKNAGYENTLEWAIARDNGEGADDNSVLFKPRESCELMNAKTRPLYAKVELLLDLMFRRLFYDPSQPDLPYTKEAVLRMIRKIDKEMGS